MSRRLFLLQLFWLSVRGLRNDHGRATAWRRPPGRTCEPWSTASRGGGGAVTSIAARAAATALRAGGAGGGGGGGGGGRPELPRRVVARNRKARFNFEVLETFEAGVALLGTEAKSCRNGKVTIVDGFAQVRPDGLWLLGVDIAPHETTGAYFQHEQKRERRLLLHKKEIRKLDAETARGTGKTIVPLQAYFNGQNRLKVEVALVAGKQKADKRESIRRREDKRDMQRITKRAGY